MHLPLYQIAICNVHVKLSDTKKTSVVRRTRAPSTCARSPPCRCPLWVAIAVAVGRWRLRALRSDRFQSLGSPIHLPREGIKGYYSHSKPELEDKLVLNAEVLGTLAKSLEPIGLEQKWLQLI